MNHRVLRMAVIMVCLVMVFNSPLHAASVFQDSNRFAYGVKRVLAAPFQIPVHTLQGTFGGPLVVGTIAGVFSGTFQTIGDLAGGLFDMGAAAAPYAKYAVLA